jgi:N-acetylneuraminate synthase
MNNLRPVEPAVAVFRKAGTPFAAMHCTSMYPTPSEKMRRGALEELGNAFPDAVLGLSDH